MNPRRILVINPNSNPGVTRRIAQVLENLQKPGDLELACTMLPKAPLGIETDEDVRTVMPMVVREITSNHADYDAFVIACLSDPGLAEARTVSKKPVFGMHESAAGLSASYGRRFGVLALGRESIQRHIAYIRQIGLQDFYAGERPLGMSADEAADGPGTLDRIIDIGRELVEEDGAETLILGCAGLAAHRRAAQDALGVPVIDPVQAAVTMARQNFATGDERP